MMNNNFSAGGIGPNQNSFNQGMKPTARPGFMNQNQSQSQMGASMGQPQMNQPQMSNPIASSMNRGLQDSTQAAQMGGNFNQPIPSITPGMNGGAGLAGMLPSLAGTFTGDAGFTGGGFTGGPAINGGNGGMNGGIAPSMPPMQQQPQMQLPSTSGNSQNQTVTNGGMDNGMAGSYMPDNSYNPPPLINWGGSTFGNGIGPTFRPNNGLPNSGRVDY